MLQKGSRERGLEILNIPAKLWSSDVVFGGVCGFIGPNKRVHLTLQAFAVARGQQFHVQGCAEHGAELVTADIKKCFPWVEARLRKLLIFTRRYQLQSRRVAQDWGPRSLRRVCLNSFRG